MQYKITNTTDGRYVGAVFDKWDSGIFLDEGFTMFPEKVIKGDDTLTLSTSNYIINAINL